MAKQRQHYLELVPIKAGGATKSVFTYHHISQLDPGQLVKVRLGPRQSLGVVLRSVPKPSFTTKPIERVLDITLPETTLALGGWISEYYATPQPRVWQTMLPSSITAKPHQSAFGRIEPTLPNHTTSITLLTQQQSAISDIIKGRARSYLLHGVTGSGKTQVYMELTKSAINRDKSTVVLVPEIFLTPQITAQFAALFGNQVLVTHSGLTTAKRRNIWLHCLNTKQPLVVIGPRSALFSPLPNLGLIIIDEVHDTSYKQDQQPRYQAASVAAKLASITGSKLVMGSATPTSADMFLAQAGKLKLINMPNRVYKNRIQPPIIVDLSKKTEKQPAKMISRQLYAALKACLDRKKQAVIFMNRRGTARLALCNNCQWVANCPNCTIPLTFHADKGSLLCHWCDYSALPPARCPKCGQFEIRFLGGGTKQVEASISKLFPSARITRLDKDSLNPKTIDALHKQINSGEIDILIGTQMIAKGLDIPGVDTIGIILADTMLYLPDYTAAERTFQLLYQVAGRAGRRENSRSTVLIQTYSPNHPAILAAAHGDYSKFIKAELIERQQLNYPPYVYLLKLTVSRSTRASAQTNAQKLTTELNKLVGVEVIGPAPAWQETLRGKYQWQIVIKSKVRSRLVAIASKLPAGWSHDLDPAGLL